MRYPPPPSPSPFGARSLALAVLLVNHPYVIKHPSVLPVARGKYAIVICRSGVNTRAEHSFHTFPNILSRPHFETHSSHLRYCRTYETLLRIVELRIHPVCEIVVRDCRYVAGMRSHCDFLYQDND